MKTHLLRIILTAILITPVYSQENDGFVKMFNGKDLTSWKTIGNWAIAENKILALKSGEGESGWKRFGAYMMTEKIYGDFILDLEFKFEPRGNSGVLMRVADSLYPVEKGMELQILDNYGKENIGHHDCGGIIRTQTASKNMVNPAGAWNRYTITLMGNSLKVAMKNRPTKGHNDFQDEAKRAWH